MLRLFAVAVAHCQSLFIKAFCCLLLLPCSKVGRMCGGEPFHTLLTWAHFIVVFHDYLQTPHAGMPSVVPALLPANVIQDGL